jgi:hypothetical protein
MKKYIKPNSRVRNMLMESLLQSHSIRSVKGVKDVTMGEGTFVGGQADSRQRDIWDWDDEEE